MAQPASVGHAVPITQIVGYSELSDKPDQKADVLLGLRDEHGTVVTLQLRRTAAHNLLQILQAGPIPGHA
jgi:hypothetical protein